MVLYEGLSGGNLAVLEPVGAVARKDTGSGWWLNVQPFVMLTAGATYQNRFAIDHLRERHDQEIEVLKARIDLLEAA